MTGAPDEAALIEARRLRDLARGIVQTDLATLRLSLAERPVGQRLRDRAVVIAVDTAEDGIDLARENWGVVAVTLAGLTGWLFRRPLGVLMHNGWRWTERQFDNWRS